MKDLLSSPPDCRAKRAASLMQTIRGAIRLRTRLRQFAAVQLVSRCLLSRRTRRGALLLPSHAVLLLSVYRNKNALTLLPLVLEAQRNGWEIRLWALDEIHPALASFSRGVGKGSKFSLLNALLAQQEWSDFDWIICADDDVVLKHGSLKIFVDIAQEAGLTLAQPSHHHLSFRSHDINLLVPFSIARLTTYVEIGPIFAVHRSLFSRTLPFPDGYGMGWGLDVRWSDLQGGGARLGIVDLVAVKHLMPAGAHYSTSTEFERILCLLNERGAKSMSELQRTLGVWRPWQRVPSWRRREPAGLETA
jgi:hypothetical protein